MVVVYGVSKEEGGNGGDSNARSILKALAGNGNVTRRVQRGHRAQKGKR